MPFSAAERIRILQIFGIPPDGTGIIALDMAHNVASLSNVWEPTYTTGSFTQLLAAVDDKLTNADAVQITNVQELITAWECIEASPMKLDGSSTGATGTVIDHPTQRENIRWEMGQIFGICIPKGGFMAAAERMRNQKDPNQPMSPNAGWGANLNDR